MTENSAPTDSRQSRAADIGRKVFWNAVLAAVYFGIANLSLAATTEHHVVSSIWPPAGIAFFAMLRFGPWLAPGVWIGAFALNAGSGTGTPAALMIATGDMLEGLVAALLVSRQLRGHWALDRVKDVLSLTLIGGVAAPMIAATVGVSALVLTGGALSTSAATLWTVWWSGDALGVIVVAPFLLVWSARESVATFAKERRLEAGVVFLIVALLTDSIFGTNVPVYFAVYPLGVWVAWRFGPRGAATVAIVITIITALRTLAGFGPFTSLQPTQNLQTLQLFLALLTVKSLLFSAARAEMTTSVSALQASEKLYRELAQNLPEGCVALYDKSLRILLVEGPALATAGFSKEGVEGKRLNEIFDEQHASVLGVPFLAALEGQVSEFEFTYNEHTYLVRVLPITEPATRRDMGMALALDVTEREVSRREIVESKAQLERLSHLLLTAQEDERRRIAREVHDELGQALTAVKIGLSHTLMRAQRRNSLDTERRISDASAALDRAIHSVQRIVLRLRPGVLDNLGPLAALEHEVQQFREQSGLSVSLDLPPEDIIIDAERSTALYRTVQEALTNILRHADAHHVSITLMSTDQELLLQVADDGRGISDAQLRKPRSMGILGMRERAAACGGRLDIFRANNGGTCLALRMPKATNGKHP